MLSLRRSLFCAALLAGFGLPVRASVVFDWPTSPAWTAGTPTAGQTVTQSFTSVDPNDITVSVNNDGISNQGATWQTGYPQISRSPLTGSFGSTNALQLYVVSQSSTSSYIRTTVTFATPVINLSFQIWDVDAVAGQFADKIFNIQALAVGGATVGADSVTSEAAGYNTITGTDLSTVVLGAANAANNTNQGTIDIRCSGPIPQFSFDWTNNDPALGQQAIGLGPLTYTAVPEKSAGWIVALFCWIAIALREKTRRAATCRARS